MTKYELWLEKAAELRAELEKMNESEIEDAFYRDLEFGTAGLRGVIGAGTNRMNVYTVAHASQGLANYIVKNFKDAKIAVSYDSRNFSDTFAKIACEVFAANGIKAMLYPELMPVPCLSFAVRSLGCDAGVMITASHNPAKYNGYKVYGADGCQMTSEAADSVTSEISGLDIFSDVQRMNFEEGMAKGLIAYIDDSVFTAFCEQVKGTSVLFGDEIDKNVSIVYSPLNGSGLKPVMRVLGETGFNNVTVVAEQEKPDGNFPTCPYPNPEIKEAMALGMEYAKKYNADLLLATDPDCDRVGIAAFDGKEYRLFTGNETGILLTDFICSQRVKHEKMPESPIIVKTIVTTDLADKIAESYGVRAINVLTGFKYIGEQIALLEEKGREDSYLLGFEESYGYLSGTYVRDKDAVNASFLICEMFAYYKTRGISLIDRLNEIYAKHGYCLNTLHSYQFEGSAGFAKMQDIMKKLRGDITEFGGHSVEKALDYLQGLDGLPSADVIKYLLDCGSVVIRPSGTEPKLKAYITVTAETEAKARETEQQIKADLDEILK